MNVRLGEHGLIGLAIVYLAFLSWAMSNLSYDIWGAFVIGPPLAVVGILGIRRMFSGELASLANVMCLGLAAKFAGAGLRYFVAFSVYGGNSDSERYHTYAAKAAANVWRGDASVVSILPGGTGTRFMERFTSLLYTLVGSSKLASFVLFSWIAFWGIAYFVKAACVAVPGLRQRRYAFLCMLAPSLVYWPSSIGKEAVMILWLGIASYGVAHLMSRRRFLRPFLVMSIGLAGAAVVRPHMAGLWIAGLLPALLVALFAGTGQRDRRDRRGGRAAERFVLLSLIVVAAVALVLVGLATVRYLHFRGEDTAATTDKLTLILNETTRRTTDGGSRYVPPPVHGLTDWPYAALRTLTRPLLTEASGSGQLLSALEMTGFLMICLICVKRVANLPRLLVSTPYLTFAMTALFFGGLVFASFGNLGILARQKSLLLPLMLLIPCVPVRSYKRGPEWVADADQNNSTSPSVRPQFDSGGIPASLTARQVRTGPPWGNGAKPAVGRG